MLDRVTNCLANINAAQRNRLPYVLCKRNNLVYRILRFLYKNRLIKGFKFYKQEFFKVYVDYEKQLDKPIIKFIKQRSSPSRYISINLKNSFRTMESYYRLVNFMYNDFKSKRFTYSKRM